MKDDVVIVSATRTPVGAFNGAFATLPAHELGKTAIKKLAAEVACTPAQLALAWVLAQPGVVTIPKSSTRERVKENLGALEVKLSPQILAELDKAFPPPKKKQSLEML